MAQITVDEAQLAELRVKLGKGKGEGEELTGAAILGRSHCPRAAAPRTRRPSRSPSLAAPTAGVRRRAGRAGHRPR